MTSRTLYSLRKSLMVNVVKLGAYGQGQGPGTEKQAGTFILYKPGFLCLGTIDILGQVALCWGGGQSSALRDV